MKDAEHHEQRKVFEWARLYESRYPELATMFSVPNGGHRHPAVAAKLKAEGVRPGVPDIVLPVARGAFHGLFIEMKSDKGRASYEQLKFIASLKRNGYEAHICHGFDEAVEAIRAYLALTKHINV
jgi:hypothetical protein